jgi:streptogramin lyase
MKTRNFGGMSRSSGVNMGMIVRVTLATFAVVGSLALAWLLLGAQNIHRAGAAGVTTVKTSGIPLGEALDGKGNLWVAESNKGAGFIGEFNISGTPTKIAETAVSLAPAFLALDSSGNVWFTEPTADAIGELSGGSVQPAITAGITKGSAPADLTFDSKGNIWFTEQKGNRIGFLNMTTKQVVEVPLAQPNASPYGIINVKGEIWFTLTSPSLFFLGHFHVPTTAGGAITVSYVPTSAGAHLLAADSSGNIWYTEGSNNAIGEYNAATKKTQDFSVVSALCGSGSTTGAVALTSQASGTPKPTKTTKQPTATTGSPTPVGTGVPTTCTNTFVAGIAVDSNNQVWFDESQTGHVGVFSPFTGKAVAVSATGNPSDGLVVDTAGNVWAASKASTVIIEVPAGTLSSGAPSTGPVNSTWYFAEGRAGKGFREYLTIDNPTANACAANIQYLYTTDGSTTPSTKTASVTVSPATRWTESVNNDLGLPDSSLTGASLAAIVTVNKTTTPNCVGLVVERPMYFSNFHVTSSTAVSSGTDVVGATTLSTTYYFADVPTGSSSSGSYTSYITVLNPNTTTANVTVNYYANGSKVQSQTLAVPATSRGTFPANAVSMPQHVAAVVTSDQPIMVERPTYFTGVNHISGAYDVVGAPQPASDWLFAEGYTGTGFQEYLTIANLDPANTASVTVTLKSGSGATNSTNLSVGPQSQTIWNVNSANTFSGSTPEVSAEVTTASSGSVAGVVHAATKTPTPSPKTKTTPTVAPTGTSSPTPTPGASGIVVQRELYFTYRHTLSQTAIGGTDVMGAIGPLSHSAYNFAEGYTNTGYNTWLTIQNPTASAETIYVTVVNGAGKSSQQKYTVLANSRFTLDMTALVQQVFVPGTVSAANSISTTVQTLDGSVFVAERPLYWNTAGSSFVTMGGSDVIGYSGG